MLKVQVKVFPKRRISLLSQEVSDFGNSEQPYILPLFCFRRFRRWFRRFRMVTIMITIIVHDHDHGRGHNHDHDNDH